MIKAIIVDDEKGAYINLSKLLASYCPAVEVCGYASNTQEASSLIAHLQPDLVFLDIKMPQETGIEFIKRIWPIKFEVVFVTAYDEFALKVFKLNALDYILKPISISYLQESMQRAEEAVAFKKAIQPKDDNTDERFFASGDDDYQNSIVLKSGNSQKRYSFDDITHLHASGSYTTFFLSEKSNIITGYNLSHYNEILPMEKFVRTHKSYIVNIKNVKEIVSQDGVSHCRLNNNELVPISRRRASDIKQKLNAH